MEGNGLKELKAWLLNNAETFKAYKLDEIVPLAIACGFDRQVVAQWYTSMKFKQAI